MSPHLHYEIARVGQNEIAARTLHAHHALEQRATAGRSRRSVTSRVGKAVVAVGLCLATTTVSGAFASPRLARTGGRMSASQLSWTSVRSRQRATRRTNARARGR